MNKGMLKDEISLIEDEESNSKDHDVFKLAIEAESK